MTLTVLSISSQVAYGNVGNSAAVPAMQARGYEVLAVPTIFLSNHPGHGKPITLRVPAPDLAAILGALDDRGILSGCSAVMTGYFAANDQIHGVARMIRRMRQRNSQLFVLVDPIIGDGDALYVPLPVAEAIRDELLPLATCITPNRFELAWLANRRVANVEEATAAARSLGVGEVLATSVPAGEGSLATLAVTNGDCFEQLTTLRKTVPHGTGDFLAGLYLAERLEHGPEEALRHSMTVLERAISISAGSAVLNVGEALHNSSNYIAADEPFIGIDGCRNAWLAVQWDGTPDSNPLCQIVQSISEFDLQNILQAAIDIPIGFPDVALIGGRQAEKEVRAFLGRKSPAVFSSPGRRTLTAMSHGDASQINKVNSETGNIGLTIFAFALFPKMNEVDRFITPELQGKLVETHPEVSFAIMNGMTPVVSNKKTPVGRLERRALLRQSGFPIDNLIHPQSTKKCWSEDDIIDACACAWTAKRVYEGVALRFPKNPPRDAKGLRMEINA